MQISYPLNPAAARAGQLYQSSQTDYKVTRTNPNGFTPFGEFLFKSTGDGNVIGGHSGAITNASVPEGIAVFTQALQSRDAFASNKAGYLPGFDEGVPFNVLRRGPIWVPSDTAFNPDTDTLYLRITANGNLVPGGYGNIADSGKCLSLASGFGQPVVFRVLNTLTAAGLLAVEIVSI